MSSALPKILEPERLAQVELDETQLQCGVPSASSTFTKVITNDLLYDIIFDYCTPATLIRFSRSSRDAHAAVKDYMARRFNINKLLMRWFDDPLAFRCMQAETETLISGSTALQFFDRSHYPESDLNLFVGIKHCLQVGQWLLRAQYTFQPTGAQSPEYAAAASPAEIRAQIGREYVVLRGIFAVFTFLKSSGDKESTPLKVRIMVCDKGTPLEVICEFESSMSPASTQFGTYTDLLVTAIAINAISFNTAYSLFPQATFEQRLALVRNHGCKSINTDHEQKPDHIEKYSKRGWYMFLSTYMRPPYPAFDPELFIYLFSSRSLHDHRVWSIPLDRNGISEPQRETPMNPLPGIPTITTVMERLLWTCGDSDCDYGDDYYDDCDKYYSDW
ncbi:hypothetical protein K474DRAFT_1179966 [Panus rudis PR-1116 ss-1]|nr:hypothetical protein K474DRAFT_1179966 [Panus rudis PR-1116 ss-1]